MRPDILPTPGITPGILSPGVLSPGTSLATGATIAIGIPVILIVLIVYLIKHRKHKPLTALLGFVVGSMLGATIIGTTITGAVVQIIGGIVNAASGILH